LYTVELGVIGRTQSRRSRSAWVHVARLPVWLAPFVSSTRNVGGNGRSEGSALGFSGKPANLTPTRTKVSRMRIRVVSQKLVAVHCRLVRSCPCSQGEISTDVANCAHLSSVDERCD